MIRQSSVLVSAVLSDQKVSEGGDLHLSCRLAAGQVAFHLNWNLPASLAQYLTSQPMLRVVDRREISSGWSDLTGVGLSIRSHWKVAPDYSPNMFRCEAFFKLLICCRRSIQGGAADQSDPLPGREGGSTKNNHVYK